MSLTAAVCLLLSEWVSFLLVAVPVRSRRTFVELLLGCMLNPEGWVSCSIGALCRQLVAPAADPGQLVATVWAGAEAVDDSC